MAEVFANSEDPDHSVASDLGLHCLPITLLGASQLQWVKGNDTFSSDDDDDDDDDDLCTVQHYFGHTRTAKL